MKTQELKRHPLSAAFPDMEAKDYAELVEDVAAHGLIQAVVTLDGMVLDGWHRYQACLDAGKKPSFEAFKGADPVAYVISLNMHRRHLTGSQRASAVVACHAWAPLGANQHGGCKPGLHPQTSEQMAEEAGVSRQTIQQAKKAQEAGLGDDVRDGKLTVKEAAAVAKLPEPERKAALEAPKPKPEPKPEPSGNPGELEALKARVKELEAENEELKERLEEMADLMMRLQEEVDAARRTLEAEDILVQFDKEIKRAQAMASTTQSRNNGLMNENSDLKGRLKSALRKIERLEKAAKEVAA